MNFMLLPLYDSNPLHRIPFPHVTVTIMAMCVVVFLVQQAMDAEAAHQALMTFGAIPAVIFGHEMAAVRPDVMPGYLTLVTSMFMHLGWEHLLGNMLFLWILGDNVEDAMGHWRYVGFFGLCGVTAALAHAGVDPQSEIPMIGASGAISGTIGAYLLLHPKAPLHTLVFYTVIAIPAWVVLGVWIIFQLFNVATGIDGSVAWWAHIGGAAVGIVLIPLFKHSDVRLFDRG
jgi:membrane associated rhomboid family serine protease